MADKITTASYATNGAAIAYGAMTLQELGVIVGITLGVLTFITNLYFQRKREAREQELHNKRMSEEDSAKQSESA